MRKILLCALLLIALLLFAPLANSLVCGDVNGDAAVNISDMVYLINYIAYSGPTPPNPLDANVDYCAGADIADVVYLQAYVFAGGPPPCSVVGDCTYPIDGMIMVDHVDGLVSPGILATGVPITFHVRYINTTTRNIYGLTNAFTISSPEGAEWTHSVADTTHLPEFDQSIVRAVVASGNGSGVDTIRTMFMAYVMPPVHQGMQPGFSGVPFTITIGPLSASDEGKSIVLDSVTFENGGSWKWVTDAASSYHPAWGGPYRYFIGYRPESATSISVSHIEGQDAPYTLPPDRNITFDMQYTNTSTNAFHVMSNGFRIYSLDGATWTESHGVNAGGFTTEMFQGGLYVNEFNNDGSGSDTIGFGAVTFDAGAGMRPGYTGVPFQITIGPIPHEDLGKTVCLDSAWYRPINNWIWGGISVPNVLPEWYGPYCFTVADTADLYYFSPLPDSLYFQCYSGGSVPAYDYFRVAETAGAGVGFSVTSSTGWLLPSKTSGFTPDSIFVTTDPTGLPTGIYQADLTVASPQIDKFSENDKSGDDNTPASG